MRRARGRGRRLARLPFLVVSGLLVAEASLAAGGGLSTPAGESCPSSWRVVESPNVGPFEDNLLHAVSATGRRDVWAVGYHTPGGGAPFGTLALHWNGARWRVVPTPSPGAYFNALFGVAAIARDDAWAVGAVADDVQFRTRPLALHWDGDAWTEVPLPATEGSVAQLLGVSARTARDVWAVGQEGDDPSVDDRPLAIHWDGDDWQAARMPDVARGVTTLSAVTPTSPSRWAAVGIQGAINEGHPLALEWTGERWRLARSRSGGRGVAALRGVAGVRPDLAWAVGFEQTGHDRTRALIQRFNGLWWDFVPAPDIGVGSALWSVAADGADAAWAVGEARTGRGGARSLILEWGDGRWSVAPTELVSSDSSQLFGVTTDGRGTVWAVGSWRSPRTGLMRTLVERRCSGASEEGHGDSSVYPD